MQNISHSTKAQNGQADETEEIPAKVENGPHAQNDLAGELAAEDVDTKPHAGIAPAAALEQVAPVSKAPRKLIEDEVRAVGHVKKGIVCWPLIRVIRCRLRFAALVDDIFLCLRIIRKWKTS